MATLVHDRTRIAKRRRAVAAAMTVGLAALVAAAWSRGGAQLLAQFQRITKAVPGNPGNATPAGVRGAEARADILAAMPNEGRATARARDRSAGADAKIGIAASAEAPPPPGVVLAAHSEPHDFDRGTMRAHFELLKQGRELLLRTSGYTATLTKRERIGGAMSGEETIEMKVRHEPFSVYMKWITGEPGKEALYVDGTNKGQVLVRLGGLKGRILPAFSIDPTGALAMSESRHPISKAGMLAMTESLIEHREREFRDSVVARCRRGSNVEIDGRSCDLYVFEFPERAKSPEYRKSIQYVDREWNVPLRLLNYAWPPAGEPLESEALDEATLIEYYSYADVQLGVELADGHFDRASSEYHFQR